MDAGRLIELWSERDARYAVRWIDGRPAPLTVVECSTIERLRICEALMLPAGKGRNAALGYVRDWHPPCVVPWRDPLADLDDDNERRRWRGRRNRG